MRQVSLRYRNPNNRPDSFETAQLTVFRDVKAAESWQVTTENGQKQLRYLLPMVSDQSCLVCHGSYDEAPRFIQRRFPRGHFSYGYKVGEVIGAVSVSVPMAALYLQIGANLKNDIVYDGIVLVAFILISGWIIRRTILTPVKTVAASIAEVARSGNFSERLEERGQDEIGALIGSFNDLMAELDRKTIQRVESEDRYRNFIEIAQSPIITFMSDGKIVISNQKAEKLFGHEQTGTVGAEYLRFHGKGCHAPGGHDGLFLCRQQRPDRHHHPSAGTRCVRPALRGGYGHLRFPVGSESHVQRHPAGGEIGTNRLTRY